MNEETLKKKYAQMSDHNKKIMFSSDIAENVNSICSTYNFDDEEKGEVANLLIMVLLGINQIDSFYDLAKKFGLDDKSADNFVSDIDKNILNSEPTKNQVALSEQDRKITEEVSGKYSLTESQMQSLQNIIGNNKFDEKIRDDYVQKISKNLEISRILSEQILVDLEKRIFSMVKPKTKPSAVITNNPDNIKNNKQTTPEIKPQIIPATEKGEVAHNTTPEEKKWFSETEKIEPNSNQPTQKSISSIPENLPGATPVEIPKTPEPVQKPVIGVPRYTGDSSEVQAASSKEEMKNYDGMRKENMVDKKLNSIVSSPSPTQTKTAPAYTGQDPYREPLEPV